LLVDADLVEDQVELARASRPTSVDIELEPARASRPTSFDVEIDCISRAEPPPESRPRRKRALLALVSGVFLLAATGVLFYGRSAALHAYHVLDAAMIGGAARTPPLSTRAALETKGSAALVQTRAAAAPSAASSIGARQKPSVHAQRAKAAVVSAKKPAKAVRTRHAPHDAT